MSTTAVTAAEDVFDAFQRKDEDKFRRMLRPMDRMGLNDCLKYLEKLESPDFSKARVFSPKTNNALYYVYLPMQTGTFQFIFRRRNASEVLMLEGVCVNKSR